MASLCQLCEYAVLADAHIEAAIIQYLSIFSTKVFAFFVASSLHFRQSFLVPFLVRICKFLCRLPLDVENIFMVLDWLDVKNRSGLISECNIIPLLDCLQLFKLFNVCCIGGDYLFSDISCLVFLCLVPLSSFLSLHVFMRTNFYLPLLGCCKNAPISWAL